MDEHYNRTMIVDGNILNDTSYLSKVDGIPIKNKLPEDIRGRLKIKSDWIKSGRIPKVGAKPFRLHSYNEYQDFGLYYLDKDVEGFCGSLSGVLTSLRT